MAVIGNQTDVTITNTPNVSVTNSPSIKRALSATINQTTDYTVPGSTYFEGTFFIPATGANVSVNGLAANLAGGMFQVTLGAGCTIVINSGSMSISGVTYST